MIEKDALDFGARLQPAALDRRMMHGGLPPFYLDKAPDDTMYAEWMDSYWAKDLQELFVVDKKTAFLKLAELLFRQSGELFEAQSFTAQCELSRQTVMNYLSIMETTLLATVLKPFAGGSPNELRRQPKVFMFDTGFVAYHRAWDKLRDTDRGHLLEHLVLTELQARFLPSQLFFWRSKQKQEVDFVLKPSRGNAVTAIECKAQWARFDASALASFRGKHPCGMNVLVCLDVPKKTVRKFKDLEVEVIPYRDLGEFLETTFPDL